MVKENKIVRGWSLSPENIKWLKERAFALSTAFVPMSASQFLDNLITAKREEQERAKRMLRDLTPAPPLTPPQIKDRFGEGKKKKEAA